MNKLGINTVKNEIMNREEYTVPVFRECLSMLKDSGFKYIEFSHVHHLSETEAAEIGEFTGQADLIPYSVHCDGNIDKHGEDDYFDIQKKCMENAKALGCEIVVFHLPHPFGTVSDNLDKVRKFADLAGQYQLKAGLENGVMEVLFEIFDKVTATNLGFTLDTGHAFRDGYDIIDIIKKTDSRLIHTHLADNFGATDDHFPPGIGLIPWQDVIRELRSIDYSGVYLVEITGKGMKMKREVESMRNLPTETEIEIAHTALTKLLK